MENTLATVAPVRGNIGTPRSKAVALLALGPALGLSPGLDMNLPQGVQRLDPLAMPQALRMQPIVQENILSLRDIVLQMIVQERLLGFRGKPREVRLLQRRILKVLKQMTKSDLP